MSKIINWDYLETYVSEGLTYEEIAKKLDCSESTVRKHIKNLQLKPNLKICKANDQELMAKVDELVKQGLTNKQISDKLGICETTTRRYTKLLGKDTNSVKTKSIDCIDLTDEQLEIIYGGMLGDMNISKTEKLARLSISQGGNHELYFDHLCDCFNGLLGKVSKKQRFDKRTNKFYNKFVVRSLAHQKYLDLYNFFYPNGTKTITEEWIKRLTPRSIAYWFMDDGSLHGELATNCFSLKEVKMLQDMFLDKYNIKTRLYNPPKTNQYVIFIENSDLHLFEDLVRPYIVDSMKYKLKIS